MAGPNQGQWQQGQMQPGSMQEMMRHHQRMMQQGMQGGYPHQMGSSQMGPMQQSTPNPVSSATQGQLKSSLESSGFKNVTVVPQSYLIRATAPDGSRIVMQVSSDSLYGVVVNPPDQTTSSSSTGNLGPSGTGSTSGSTGGGERNRQRGRQHRRYERHRRRERQRRQYAAAAAPGAPALPMPAPAAAARGTAITR